ncbi:VOC family protein [Kordiimonas pumila]|uniref:VOC family protein n=1 Tax=Kordiimonas pumila TaxID=2161677 RepID=A0ABV7D1R7_9PROT|nr:VOC family protein [Kordiimonas pumila]
MIGYTTIGTNKHSEACAFYDTLLAILGAKRAMEFDSFVMWAAGPDKPAFALTKPYDGKAASVGNGVMIALKAPDRATVDKLYETALANGGSCEGKPGLRGSEDMGFYAAYFRDIEGNKLNAFCMGPA